MLRTIYEGNGFPPFHFSLTLFLNACMSAADLSTLGEKAVARWQENSIQHYAPCPKGTLTIAEERTVFPGQSPVRSILRFHGSIAEDARNFSEREYLRTFHQLSTLLDNLLMMPMRIEIVLGRTCIIQERDLEYAPKRLS